MRCLKSLFECGELVASQLQAVIVRALACFYKSLRTADMLLVTRETRLARDTALEPAHGALGWAERVEDFPPISEGWRLATT